jgi:GSCFA family
MSNPYRDLPSKHFWRTAVAERNIREWSELYTKRIEMTSATRISAAGSCFAQHIGRQLKLRRFAFQDFELAPASLAPESRLRFGYDMFSARYGNVYTARQMLQLLRRAFGEFTPAVDAWENDGRFYDPFRPSVEAGGFVSLHELRAVREAHFTAVRRLFTESDVFIFTLGLTEAWIDRVDGAVYPICPGTIAGRFDQTRHQFVNFNYGEVLSDMSEILAIGRKMNPALKFLLTVSPVPLTATASPNHVLVATTYSKSVLRAVAGDLYGRHDFVDYFPSYEIITAPAARGGFYETNMREVTERGVKYVMSHFFSAHAPAQVSDAIQQPPAVHPQDAYQRQIAAITKEMEVICDENKLDEMNAS